MKKSEMKFVVTFDDNNVPEKIEWSSPDSQGEHSTKSLMISIWDAQQRNTLRLDLWTKQMTVDEMMLFHHQSLHSMADSFERATGKTGAAAAMRDLADHLSEK